jgi:N-ethylmaleimide reductase
VSTAERSTAIRRVRTLYPHTLMVNGGFDQAGGNAVIADGSADLVSYAQPFIANPDLPARFARGIALAHGDRATFYQGGAHGYVDYAAAEDSAPAPAPQVAS